MINCRYLQVNEPIVFGTIISEKNEPGRTILRNGSKRVLGTYSTYLGSFPNIQANRSAFLRKELDIRNALKSCYSSATQTFQLIRGKIFSTQPNFLIARCPYCLLNSPDTLDHYVGQTEFPEYAILVKNLVPCCTSCNKAKGERWRKNGIRRFIHFYNDAFLSLKFLNAKLIYKRGGKVPSVVFTVVRPAAMTAGDFAIVRSHFKDLDLLRKYVLHSIPIISSELTVLKRGVHDGQTKDQLIGSLKARSDEAANYGVNYWVSVIYDALAGDDRFIRSVLE